MLRLYKPVFAWVTAFGLLSIPIGARAAPEVGQPAPDFTLRRLDGGRVSLRSLRGRVVLLDFWAPQ